MARGKARSRQSDCGGGRHTGGGSNAVQRQREREAQSTQCEAVIRLQRFKRAADCGSPMRRGSLSAEDTDMDQIDQRSDGSGSKNSGAGNKSLSCLNNDALLGSNDAAEPTLSDVLQAIQQGNKALESQISSLKEEMGLVRHDVKKIKDRTKEAEQRISDLEDTVLQLRHELQQRSDDIWELYDKSDDLENRSRRNNIRMVGVPEKIEGSDPTSFFEKWLQDTVGSDSLSRVYAVERAHRVPTGPGIPGRPPRPVLIKILHYRDRDTILRKAREMEPWKIEGAKVSLFPDYSKEVQRRRAQFYAVKRRLRDLGVTYAMLFPSRLRISALNKSIFFENPKEAMDWLDAHEKHLELQKDSGKFMTPST